MPKTIWYPANIIKKVKINRAGAAAFKNLDRYDWILFTSKNAVRFFIDEAKLRRIKIPGQIKIGAVGPETALALKRSGFKISLMPKKFSAEHLVSALGKKVAGKRVLFPRSVIASPEPVRKLRENGAKVDVMHLYTAIPKRISRQLLTSMKMGDFKYIVFISPSAVADFIKKAKENAGETRTISAVCIGPSTALAARGFPFKKIHTAKMATKAGIARLLRQLA
jgi:uroporphyrinogen-III synthase